MHRDLDPRRTRHDKLYLLKWSALSKPITEKRQKSLKITNLASAPINKKHSKNNSKDQRRSKDTKWVRPKRYYCRYERERRG